MSEVVDKTNQSASSQNQNSSQANPQGGREHPIIGRKVFFVNPPLYVENYLNLELRSMEYEVYIISDYRDAKPALRKFPDALCFLYVDDSLSMDGWYKYIKSFQTDSILRSIFVGVISANASFADRKRFVMDLCLPSGFIMLNEFKGSHLTDKIVGILELNGARGRRKYIRLDCEEDVSVNGYFAYNSRLFQVRIDNISSTGFACSYPKNFGDILSKNTLIPNFSVTLGRKSIVCPSVVFDTRSLDSMRFFSVMLFVKQVDQQTRDSIRNFIYDTLQSRFESMLLGLVKDLTDYEPTEEEKKEMNASAQTSSSGFSSAGSGTSSFGNKSPYSGYEKPANQNIGTSGLARPSFAANMTSSANSVSVPVSDFYTATSRPSPSSVSSANAALQSSSVQTTPSSQTSAIQKNPSQTAGTPSKDAGKTAPVEFELLEELEELPEEK